MSLIEKIKAESEKKRRAVHIKSIGETIYLEPMTVADVAPGSTFQLQKKEATNDYERAVIYLIHKARLKNGERAFSSNDYDYLMNHADLGVVMEMVGAQEEAEAVDAKKKSSES